ncbi:MAG: hypothetical protein WC718_01285 [Phycisphaerales bacterium]
MLGLDPRDLAFQGNVLGGFGAVCGPKRGRKVALAMFAAVNQGDDVIQFPRLARHDFSA